MTERMRVKRPASDSRRANSAWKAPLVEILKDGYFQRKGLKGALRTGEASIQTTMAEISELPGFAKLKCILAVKYGQCLIIDVPADS